MGWKNWIAGATALATAATLNLDTATAQSNTAQNNDNQNIERIDPAIQEVLQERYKPERLVYRHGTDVNKDGAIDIAILQPTNEDADPHTTVTEDTSFAWMSRENIKDHVIVAYKQDGDGYIDDPSVTLNDESYHGGLPGVMLKDVNDDGITDYFGVIQVMDDRKAKEKWRGYLSREHGYELRTHVELEEGSEEGRYLPEMNKLVPNKEIKRFNPDEKIKHQYHRLNSPPNQNSRQITDEYNVGNGFMVVRDQLYDSWVKNQ